MTAIPPQAPSTRSALLTAAGLLVLCVLAVRYAMSTPEPVPATAPATEFSAERAMAHVREIARTPHPAGSDAHGRVRAYIADRLAAMGVEPRVQNTTGVGTRYAVAGRVYNVIARVPGLLPPRPRGAVLIAVHYDGVAAGPAAADDAAAVGAALETLRALRSAPLLANDVIVLFADGEEAGLIGAEAFAREHPWARDVGVILNFEARGVHGPSLMFETGQGNSDVIRFLRAAPGSRATSLSTAVYRALPNDTDLSELVLLGRPAMNFAFIGGVERYHTTEDDTTHLSRGSVQHHGQQMLALARSFGSARLPRPETRDAVFFDVPGLGILAYSEVIAAGWGILGFLLAVAALVLARRREEGAWRSAALGALGLLLSIVVAGAIAFGVSALLLTVHALIPGGGAPQWRAVYAIAVIALAVATATTIHALLRRVASPHSLHIGALLLLAALGLYLSIAAPGTSFLLGWPALIAAAAALVGIGTSRPGLALAASWVSTIASVLMVVPLTWLMVVVALGVAGAGAALLGILGAVLSWLVMPRLETVGAGAGSLRVAIVAAAVGALLIVLGIATVRSDARRPAGVSFVYAVDADSGSAWLSGWATTRGARRWIDGALGERAQGTAPRWVARLVGTRRIVPAPAAGVPAPSATIVSDSAAADARFVTFRVRAAPRTSAVDVVAEAGDVMNAWVDNRPVDPTRYRRRPGRWELEYIAPSDSGFVLTLAFRPGTTPALSLLARTPGIPAAVTVPSRPPGLLPIQVGDGTYVFRRVAVPDRGT